MRSLISILLTASITVYPAPLSFALATSGQDAGRLSPEQLLEKDFIELFRLAPGLNLSDDTLEEMEKQVENERKREKDRIEEEVDSLEDGIDQAQKELKQLNRDGADSSRTEETRHQLHCKIQEARKQLQEKKLELEKGVELEYDAQLAKVRIIREWPQQYRRIQEQIEQQKAVEREFGDFRDVGFRGGVFEGQEEDVEKGREAIEEMRRQQILPPEVDDEEVQIYIQRLGDRIARHSDLRVPLKVTLLNSKEINAFALPGGFLFVNSELVLTSENEAQLAGVLAHEIAHVAARHSNRLMGKANIANIIFQAAQLAALIFTGGISSLATYYALQYGFQGLGLVLSLSLLGVSRDYEVEADILGTQYLWHAGYDTDGFINFFSQMAREKGYVTGLSWFRTHPPFYERMSRTFEEIMYLPQQEEPVTDTAQFQNARERLKRVSREMEERDREAPTLKRIYHCDDQVLSGEDR